MIRFTVLLVFRFNDLIFPNIKAGITLIEETGKNTTDEEQKKKNMSELGQMHSWILNFQCGASISVTSQSQSHY